MSTNPIMSQITQVTIEIVTTVGTKYADNLSANFWIGAYKKKRNEPKRLDNVTRKKTKNRTLQGSRTNDYPSS